MEKNKKIFTIDENRIILIILFSIIYSITAQMFSNANFFAVLFPNIFLSCFFINNLKIVKNKKIYIIFFLINLLLLLYNSKYKNLPFTNIDWGNFHNFANKALNSNNIFEVCNKSTDLFVFVMAIIYKIFGSNPNNIYYYIFPLSLLLYKYEYKVVYEITNNQNKSLLAAILINVWPVNFIFSLSLLREIPIQLLTLISFYNMIKFIKYDKNIYAFISILFILGAVMMHSGMIGILLIYIYIIIQKKIFKNIKIFNFPIIIIIIILFIILIKSPIWAIIGRRFSGIKSLYDIPQIIYKQNQYLVANTSYINYLPNSFIGTILYSPYRTIMFALSPFIWQVYSFETLIAFLVDGIWRLLIWILIIKIMFTYKKDEKNCYIIKLAFMMLIITFFIFGTGVNNYGAAMRHRSKILPIEITLVICYTQYEQGKIKKKGEKMRSIILSKITQLIPDHLYLKLKYRYAMKKKLNLKNPETYTEKLQWLKLHDRKDVYTSMVDKYEAKKIVADMIGEEYIIPTLGIYNSFDEIDFHNLPNKFVLKPTHTSGDIIICTDKKELDYNKLKKIVNKWLKKQYYWCHREWPYKNVKPRIIVEKYMVDESGYELKDYKFFTFHGKVKAMFIATDRNAKTDTCFDFYDEKFNHLPFLNGHPNTEKEIKRPEQFEKMIYLAETLGKDIPHVRVDFYNINGKIYFGEMTFYHWSGFVPFEPEEWDYKFGDYINLRKVGLKNYDKN